MKKYLFTSDRLGFRNWKDADLVPLSQLNADPEVMRYFLACLSVDESHRFIQRMTESYKSKGYCYFAVDELATGTFIGFIGLAYQTYPSPFTPAVDIGWRLARSYWYKGLAVEGALQCLAYGFEDIKLHSIHAVAPKINVPSLRIMEKIGMTHYLDFEHSALSDYPKIRTCSAYRITV